MKEYKKFIELYRDACTKILHKYNLIEILKNKLGSYTVDRMDSHFLLFSGVLDTVKENTSIDSSANISYHYALNS